MSAERYRPSAILIVLVVAVTVAAGVAGTGMIAKGQNLTPASVTLPDPVPDPVPTCADSGLDVVEEPIVESAGPAPTPTTAARPVPLTRPVAARADGLCPVWPLECDFYATANLSNDVLTVYINNPDKDSRDAGVKVIKIESAFYRDTPKPDKATEKIDVPFKTANGQPDPVTGQGDGDGLYTFDYSKNVDENGKVKPIGVKIELTVTVKCFNNEGKLEEKPIYFRFQLNTAGPRPTIMKLR
jgi:hypothetical protein